MAGWRSSAPGDGLAGAPWLSGPDGQRGRAGQAGQADQDVQSGQTGRSGRPGSPPVPSFWEKVRIPRFRSAVPRVILFTSGYFLEREITRAATRLGWELLELPLPPGRKGSSVFLESLLTAAVAFRPDFVLTVNHLGLDRQGELLNLFERMALPLASWFVDSPRLILHDYPGQLSPWCALFTWDLDTVAPLKQRGFEQVHYLPLATDTSLFVPGVAARESWRSRVSFVGDSMAAPVEKLKKRLRRHRSALDRALEAAPAFAASPAREVLDFLGQTHDTDGVDPADGTGETAGIAGNAGTGRADGTVDSAGVAGPLRAAWVSLPDDTARLDLEQLITFEATRVFRLERVKTLLPFEPLIAGDPGWRDQLPPSGWRLHPPLDYYRELPGFYPASEVNFNATSLQMKGAVNQRVFDVPACGAFLLTDRRDQMADLFDQANESATYRDPGEVPGLVRHYLDHPAERERIAQAARARVLADHDYTARLKAMLKAMRRRYA